MEIKGDFKVVCGYGKRLARMVVFFMYLSLEAQVKELEVHHRNLFFGVVVNSLRNMEETIMLIP
jgi:hypothetical protein